MCIRDRERAAADRHVADADPRGVSSVPVQRGVQTRQVPTCRRAVQQPETPHLGRHQHALHKVLSLHCISLHTYTVCTAFRAVKTDDLKGAKLYKINTVFIEFFLRYLKLKLNKKESKKQGGKNLFTALRSTGLKLSLKAVY